MSQSKLQKEVDHDYFYYNAMTTNDSVDCPGIREWAPLRLADTSICFHSTPSKSIGFGCVTENQMVCKRTDLEFLSKATQSHWQHPIPNGTWAVFLCSEFSRVPNAHNFNGQPTMFYQSCAGKGRLTYRRLTKRVHAVFFHKDVDKLKLLFGLVVYPAFADEADSMLDREHQEAFTEWYTLNCDADFVHRREHGHVVLYSDHPIPYDHVDSVKMRNESPESFLKTFIKETAGNMTSDQVMMFVEESTKKLIQGLLRSSEQASDVPQCILFSTVIEAIFRLYTGSFTSPEYSEAAEFEESLNEPTVDFQGLMKTEPLGGVTVPAVPKMRDEEVIDDKPSFLFGEMMTNQDLIELLTKRIVQSTEITRQLEQWEKDHNVFVLPPPSTSYLIPEQMASLEKFSHVPADERPEVEVLKLDERLKIMEEVRADLQAEDTLKEKADKM